MTFRTEFDYKWTPVDQWPPVTWPENVLSSSISGHVSTRFGVREAAEWFMKYPEYRGRIIWNDHVVNYFIHRRIYRMRIFAFLRFENRKCSRKTTRATSIPIKRLTNRPVELRGAQVRSLPLDQRRNATYGEGNAGTKQVILKRTYFSRKLLFFPQQVLHLSGEQLSTFPRTLSSLCSLTSLPSLYSFHGCSYVAVHSVLFRGRRRPRQRRIYTSPKPAVSGRNRAKVRI